MARSLTAVRHIFFDLDHTLWDLEKSSEETLDELFVEYGFESRGLDSGFFKSRFHELTQVHWDLYGQGKITKEQIRERRFVELLGEMGLPAEDVPPLLTVEYTDRCPRKPHLMPHTERVLQTLGKNFHLHILTNGYKAVQALKMQSSGLSQYFDSVITSECGHGMKPGKAIFDYALGTTGATVKDALMVGDNHETDIQGAAEAGWASVFYNPKRSGQITQADYEVSCLSELEHLLYRDRG